MSKSLLSRWTVWVAAALLLSIGGVFYVAKVDITDSFFKCCEFFQEMNPVLSVSLVILSLVFQCLVFYSTSFWNIGAGFMYGGFHGFIVSMFALTLGAFLNFIIARVFLKEWVKKKLEEWNLFSVSALSTVVKKKGNVVVFLTRFSTPSRIRYIILLNNSSPL